MWISAFRTRQDGSHDAGFLGKAFDHIKDLSFVDNRNGPDLYQLVGLQNGRGVV